MSRPSSGPHATLKRTSMASSVPDPGERPSRVEDRQRASSSRFDLGGPAVGSTPPLRKFGKGNRGRNMGAKANMKRSKPAAPGKRPRPSDNNPGPFARPSSGRRRVDDGAPSVATYLETRDDVRDRHKVTKSQQSQKHASAKGYALPRNDDADGHLVYCLGDGLCPTEQSPHGRYKILSDLGEGTFGKVVECWDRHEAVRVAIKIVRSVSKYRDAARLEIEVLEHLGANDPGGKYLCVRLRGWFEYRAHVCIVFEKLGPSLYEHLKRNRFRPFSLEQVREIALQLLQSVHFVHSLTLIHTDLKPENILLADAEMSSADVASDATHTQSCGGLSAAKAELSTANRGSDSRSTRQPRSYSDRGQGKASSVTPPHTPPKRTEAISRTPTTIKLVDFGSATFESHHHSAVISTRHYRAPEVILGLGWTYPCDLWSIGCILVELYTGQALFQTHENLEHLAMMHTVLGPIPESMIQRADRYSQKYFTPAASTITPQRTAGNQRRDERATSRRSLERRVRNGGINPYGWASGSGNDVFVFDSRPRRRASRTQTRAAESGALSTASASGPFQVGIMEDRPVLSENVAGLPSRTLNWPAGASSVASVKAVRRVKSLANMVNGSEEDANFLDLLYGLLAFEPDRRFTAASALMHPFCAGSAPSDQLDTPTVSSAVESSACASNGTVIGGSVSRSDAAARSGGDPSNNRDVEKLDVAFDGHLLRPGPTSNSAAGPVADSDFRRKDCVRTSPRRTYPTRNSRLGVIVPEVIGPPCHSRPIAYPQTPSSCGAVPQSRAQPPTVLMKPPELQGSLDNPKADGQYQVQPLPYHSTGHRSMAMLPPTFPYAHHQEGASSGQNISHPASLNGNSTPNGNLRSTSGHARNMPRGLAPGYDPRNAYLPGTAYVPPTAYACYPQGNFVPVASFMDSRARGAAPAGVNISQSVGNSGPVAEVPHGDIGPVEAWNLCSKPESEGDDDANNSVKDMTVEVTTGGELSHVTCVAGSFLDAVCSEPRPV